MGDMLFKPYEDMRQIGDCTLYLGDCGKVMPFLEGIDAVVTDPPYGIGADKGVGEYGRNRGYTGDWDASPPSPWLIAIIREISSAQIIWGGNYFDLPPTRGYLVWDKGGGFKGRDFAECEFAWTSMDANARTLHRDPLARGDYRGDLKVHPTQKPIEVMRWCLSHVPDAKTICDPFMGAGTTGVACARDGRTFIGIEQHRPYFEAACRRIEEAYQQPDMLAPKSEAPRPVQEELL